MSDDSPSGQTTTVTNRAPWAGQQPYLEKGLQQAQDNIEAAFAKAGSLSAAYFFDSSIVFWNRSAR